MMCSDTLAAPCIVDDEGTSCKALEKPEDNYLLGSYRSLNLFECVLLGKLDVYVTLLFTEPYLYTSRVSASSTPRVAYK